MQRGGGGGGSGEEGSGVRGRRCRSLFHVGNSGGDRERRRRDGRRSVSRSVAVGRQGKTAEAKRERSDRVFRTGSHSHDNVFDTLNFIVLKSEI